MVAAIGASELPPNPKTLRDLAELQLVIKAIEEAIADKSDASFLHQFADQSAAA